MSRWLLVLAVTVAHATVWADSRQPVAVTDTAESTTKIAERRVAQLTVHRAVLAKRYKDELDQIDRLKNQRASWRRDRELRNSLSDSLETANQLSAATRELEKAKIELASARRSYLTAIDAELSAGTAPGRAQQLAQAKAQLAPQVKDAPRRIVIPDFNVDPLADPEELDQRAAELDHLTLLRKQHDRAGDLFSRDDDEPHRSTARPSEGGTPPDDTPGGGKPGGTLPPNFENFVPIVLSDVIDASTINSVAAAQRSGDPAQRAAAAHQAYDAVARRLDEVRNHRLEIEARSRRLRSSDKH